MGQLLQFYDLAYHCRNCHEYQYVWIKKGKRAPDAVVCRKCGCSTK